MDDTMKAIADPCAHLSTGYLLVDVCAYSEINYEGFRRVSCIPSALTEVEELMPCLISVSDLTPLQLEQIIENFRQQVQGDHTFAICAWIECDLEIAALAEHVACFLCGPGPNGGKVHWRFFDPRSFALSMLVFSQDQFQSLLGPIKSWKFTWRRGWWQVSQKNFNSNPLFDFHTGWPTAQQWPIMQGGRVINKVINRLCEERMPPPEESKCYLKAALPYVADSLQLNLDDEDDQSEFVYLCMKYGASYRRHPELALSWNLLMQGKISWTDVRSKLLPADFEHLDIALYS